MHVKRAQVSQAPAFYFEATGNPQIAGPTGLYTSSALSSLQGGTGLTASTTTYLYMKCPGTGSKTQRIRAYRPVKIQVHYSSAVGLTAGLAFGDGARVVVGTGGKCIEIPFVNATTGAVALPSNTGFVLEVLVL